MEEGLQGLEGPPDLPVPFQPLPKVRAAKNVSRPRGEAEKPQMPFRVRMSFKHQHIVIVIVIVIATVMTTVIIVILVVIVIVIINTNTFSKATPRSPASPQEQPKDGRIFHPGTPSEACRGLLGVC